MNAGMERSQHTGITHKARRTTGDMIGLVICVLLLMEVGRVTSAGPCEYYQSVALGTTYYVYSPNYPSFYRPSTYCRWFADSPPGTALNLNCYDVNIPQTAGCGGDHVSVSLSGDLQFNDGHRYCGVGDFQVTSTGSRLAVELIVGLFTRGGRFSCSINAVRTIQPPAACDCGWSQKPRIVGGTETAVNEYPMMAALVDGVLRILYCGSTIISTRFVLTAAHCLLERRPDEVAVLIGEHDTKTGNDTKATQLILSDMFVSHPEYVASTQVNDIAVVRLSREIVFSKDVGPACLPIRYRATSFQGQLVTVLGWGRTDFGGPLSPRLKQVRLKVIEIKDCSTQLNSNVITDKQMCTFAPNEDACQSDSGGPVLWQDADTGRLQLVGVISYGVGCASNFPGVNTRVGAYIDWIEKAK